ncbi:unnamed protein product [Heligmosomoides polygyrus]|uniref:C2H2-type domain-containing protein n=1 Tax=Heligmosomoides polygyrus TaxID=6339 RepID=A0A183GLL7_HELPZ|nr:unnamed protein product [Heligmosomoides polygyrus]
MPSPQWACPECGKVLLEKNLYTHLASIHLLTPAEVARVKEEISRKAGVAAVVCPLCCLNFVSYESLVSHCQKGHADDGADGRPQDYSLLDLNFNSVQEYECWFQRQCSRTCSQGVSLMSRVRECNRAGVYTNTSTKECPPPSEMFAIARVTCRKCSDTPVGVSRTCAFRATLERH